MFSSFFEKRNLNPAAVKLYIYHYFFVTLGCMLIAISGQGFYVPNRTIDAGISGVATILYYLLGTPIGFVALLLNIPLFFFAFKFLERRYFISTIYGTIVLSIFYDSFAFLRDMQFLDDRILYCLVGGLINGLGCGFVYRVGGSTGGVDIIGAYFQRNYSISMSTMLLISNCLVMLVGFYFFGITPVAYSVLTFLVSSKVGNMLITGFNFKKSIMIISDHGEEIAEHIMQVVGSAVTYLNVEGASSHTHRKAILVIVPMTQMSKIRAICEFVDPDAFMFIHDVNDAMGANFAKKKGAPPKARVLSKQEIAEHIAFKDEEEK